MYRLPDTVLDVADATALSDLQSEVDGAKNFPARVRRAKKKFKSKPRPLFKNIRSRLRAMSGDLVRCNYCEDSRANDVEHILPKDFYPEYVFDWSNYAFACNPCNGPKNNKAAVLTLEGEIDLRDHRATSGIVPPPLGSALLINPRIDDPLEFLWLDLTGNPVDGPTFRFVVKNEDDPVMSRRAAWTIETLGLNERDLPECRRNAFDGYYARLSQYVADKLAGTMQIRLDTWITSLRKTPHRTVWLEMLRQRTGLQAIEQLLTLAPEAIEW